MGSRTMFGRRSRLGPARLRKSATALATFPEPSIPTWTAWISMSAPSSSSVSVTSNGSAGSTRFTPEVDWTVSAVIEDTP